MFNPNLRGSRRRNSQLSYPNSIEISHGPTYYRSRLGCNSSRTLFFSPYSTTTSSVHYIWGDIRNRPLWIDQFGFTQGFFTGGVYTLKQILTKKRFCPGRKRHPLSRFSYILIRRRLYIHAHSTESSSLRPMPR
jgi:hypothetical protein